MPRRRMISRDMQERVRRRAQYLCEYCHTAEPWQYVRFTVDHVLPLAQGGTDALDNLALACFHCNRRKADRLTATDPHGGAAVPLFNPRQHVWRDHFIWSANGLIVIGVTPIGQATIAALELNRERAVNIRAADIAVGRHPPSDDPMQQMERRSP